MLQSQCIRRSTVKAYSLLQDVETQRALHRCSSLIFVILCSLTKCLQNLFSIMINGFTFILEVIFGECPYRCKQIKGKRLLKSFLRRYNNLIFLSWENRWSYLSMVLESKDSKAFLIHRTHLSHSLLFNKTWNSYKCTILNFYKRRNVEMHQ